MTYLLDTNVISELRRPAARRNQGVVDWTGSLAAEESFVSVITVSELATWLALVEHRDPVQGTGMKHWFDQVLHHYRERILAVDTTVAVAAGRLHVPDPRDYRDAFIAATALVQDLVVATRNVGDFEPMGVEVFNPFA